MLSPRFALAFRHALTVPVAVAAIAWLPGDASAANNCQGAPGTSAVEQYCEAIPRADGGRQLPPKRVAKNGRGGGGKTGGTVPSELRRAGEDGLAVARFAATAPAVESGPSDASTASPKADRAGTAPVDQRGAIGEPTADTAQPSGTAFSGARHAITAGPTAGPELAWSLVALSGLAVGGTLVGRRRQPGPVSDGEPDLDDRS